MLTIILAHILQLLQRTSSYYSCFRAFAITINTLKTLFRRGFFTVDHKCPICYNITYTTKLGAEMTKKHFIAMAQEISQMPNMAHRLATAIAFCRVVQTTNPRFDQAKFLDACGI